ncbi:MAG: amino acid ABC transporter permease [Clostridia bacterium]|nr:amino acid ABC transporter permease [Clostridia bacterium]
MSFLDITLDLLEGFGISCMLFALTLLFAIPLGLLFSFGTMSKHKVIKVPTKVFVWIIRGIPLMLFIFVIYYLPGLIGGISMNVFNTIDREITVAMGATELMWHGRFLAVLIAFVINYACYFSEIFRGGIESISKGQYEAGQVLGLTKTQIFFKVILKQVVKRIVPSMSNEIITLVKDTALANAIAIPEIIKCAKDMASTQALIWPIFYTAVFYLIFVGGLTLLFGFVEKKLSYFKS